MLSIRALGVFFCLALMTVPAASQDLFNRGKDLLRGLGDTRSTTPGAGTLSVGEIASGLKEALSVGAQRVVATLGSTDGFNKASDIHIPLPGSLQKVQSALGKLGMGSLGDDLELRLNRAAEAAVPKAQKLFTDAIAQMSIDDAKGILNGPKDAATQYFRSKMSAPLAGEMKPIVDSQLAAVGALGAYDRMMGQYKSIPFVPNATANLSDYVVGRAIDGVFVYLAKEEAAIRENPARRTTELLRKVFGR